MNVTLAVVLTTLTACVAWLSGTKAAWPVAVMALFILAMVPYDSGPSADVLKALNDIERQLKQVGNEDQLACLRARLTVYATIRSVRERVSDLERLAKHQQERLRYRKANP